MVDFLRRLLGRRNASAPAATDETQGAQAAQAVIRKENGKWYLYSRDGSKRLGGPYDSREEAERRERQVEYFQHTKK